MSAGHFSYLYSDPSPGQTKIASDRLELLAKTAAKRYLEEHAPLNDTIRKIAEENDLNSNQIERVCEMANIATHKGLWSKTAEKEKVAFPLADSRTIMSVVKKQPMDGGCGCDSDPCGCGQPMVSPSSVDSDYAGPPKGIPGKGPSMLSMFGSDPAEVHNGLGQEPERKRIIIVLQKRAAAKKELKDALLYKGMELESIEKRAYQVIKQAVLGGTSFRQIFDAAIGSGLGKVANEYLPKFQDRLIGETHGEIHTRLVKCAIHKAPEELISDKLGNIVVVNGAHPTMVSLDTIQRKTGEIKNGIDNLLRIDDEVKILQQRMRELS